MSYEFLLFEKKGKTAHITINRPEALNALNWKTMNELRAALESVRDDAGVGGVIITGAGEKSFVAGADIKELATKDPVGAKEFSLASQELHRAFSKAGHRCDKWFLPWRRL